MMGRTIIWALVLALVAFGVFEWQRNAKLESDLALIRQKLAERDVAQEPSVPAATEAEDTKIALLRRQNEALSNRANRLETELVAARRSHDQVPAQASTSPPEAAREDVAHQLRPGGATGRLHGFRHTGGHDAGSTQRQTPQYDARRARAVCGESAAHLGGV